mmetsp:Transcript_37423/g.45185  ORF Transcript_37423/g.45185 Transcript_37423/m.45185 type:complete len:265 (-) Transcript_37423:472-1266(-)
MSRNFFPRNCWRRRTLLLLTTILTARTLAEILSAMMLLTACLFSCISSSSKCCPSFLRVSRNSSPERGGDRPINTLYSIRCRVLSTFCATSSSWKAEMLNHLRSWSSVSRMGFTTKILSVVLMRIGVTTRVRPKRRKKPAKESSKLLSPTRLRNQEDSSSSKAGPGSLGAPLNLFVVLDLPSTTSIGPSNSPKSPLAPPPPPPNQPSGLSRPPTPQDGSDRPPALLSALYPSLSSPPERPSMNRLSLSSGFAEIRKRDRCGEGS